MTKASSTQQARIRDLLGKLGVHGRSLGPYLPHPISQLSGAEASTLIKALIDVDGITTPDRATVLTAVRDAFGGAAPPPHGWVGEVAELVGIDSSAERPCPRCDGAGKVPGRPPAAPEALQRLFGVKYKPTRAQAIVALRAPRWERLQAIAKFFDGDLNDAATYAQRLAEAIEAEASDE